MKICYKCNVEFETNCVVNGIRRNLQNRKYCLICSPFGSHNTTNLNRKLDRHYCEFCNNELRGWQKKYCNSKCMQSYLWERKKLKIKDSGHVNINRKFNQGSAKRYLLEEYGVKCSVCKGTFWQGKDIPLVLDHMDGNSDNWCLNNLRLVCGNCDMQLPTYKAKNMGNGRFSRRQRYKDGKSY